MRLIDNFFLLLIGAGLLAVCIFYFQSAGVASSNDVYGMGRVIALLFIIAVIYLIFINPLWVNRTSGLTRAVMFWAVWTFAVSIQLTNFTESREWLAGYGLPALLWPCVYLFFVGFAGRNSQSQGPGYVFLVITLVSCLCVFLVREKLSSDNTKQLVVLNAAYYPLIGIVWLLLLKNGVLRLTAIFLVIVVVFVSLKRTSLIALCLATLAYMTCNLINASTMRQRIKTLLYSIFFVGCGVITFTILDESGGFLSRFESVTNDEGSGRLGVYKSYINEFSTMDGAQVIVGHGFNSGVSLMGISAHNDWLESLYDFGIVGLAVYAALNMLLLKRVFMLIKLKSPFAGPYAASYAIFVIMSMISHLIIYPNYFTVMVAFWGWVEGCSDNKAIQRTKSCATLECV